MPVSPRETPMKEPTSTHKLSSCVLLVGMPICQNTGSKTKAPCQGTDTLSKTKTPRQGTNTLSKAECLAKLSTKTWLNFLSLVFAPRVSFLSPMPHGLPARQRGAPSIALRGALTSRGLTQPPALWSPDSHIPKRRWCSAKRGS